MDLRKYDKIIIKTTSEIATYDANDLININHGNHAAEIYFKNGDIDVFFYPHVESITFSIKKTVGV